MPKEDISRYDVASKMLSKNKFDFLNAKINYFLLIGYGTIQIFFKHFFRKPQRLIVSNILEEHLRSFFQSIM
jgi:hypothetical protein